MKVIIIEDEISAVENMKFILNEIDPQIEILAELESVEDSVNWLSENDAPDLAFLDIQLSDGLSFEIFEKVEVTFPVVFTTAFNDFAIKAFKVNSIDYILKPIKSKDVAFAIDKFNKITGSNNKQNELISSIMNAFRTQSEDIKKNILVKKFDGIIPLPIEKIAFIHIDLGIVTAYNFEGDKHILQENLDELEGRLSTSYFFRANRQCIISKKAITEANHYFGGKLKLKTEPAASFEILISKAKVKRFKNWLES